MWRRRNTGSLDPAADRLGEALDAWRQAPPASEALSAVTREGIREAITTGPASLRALPLLFVPVRRIALAGGMPAALLIGVILLLARGDGTRTLVPGSLRVQATKEGNHVVFTLANGSRTHTVYTSHVPNDFDARSGVPVRERFTDALTSGADLTFYRVD